MRYAVTSIEGVTFKLFISQKTGKPRVIVADCEGDERSWDTEDLNLAEDLTAEASDCRTLETAADLLGFDL